MVDKASAQFRTGRRGALLAGILAGGIALCAALFGVVRHAQAASVSWDFALGGTGGDLGHSATFSAADGTILTAEAYAFTIFGLDWRDADVRSSTGGLGVDAGHVDLDRKERLNVLEVLRLELPADSVSAQLELTTTYENPYFAIWTNDDGSLPDFHGINGTVLADGHLSSSDTTISLGDGLSTYLYLTGGLHLDDSYHLSWKGYKLAGVTAETKSVDVTSPVPPAFWLFGSALAALGVFGTRGRKAAD